MRLIDADAERERLKKGYCEECTRKGNYGIFGAACVPCWVKDAIEEFDNAQTVEAEPVRHGQWIDTPLPNSRVAKCSLCGFWQRTNGDDKTGKHLIHNAVYRYCAGCGARMDGGADNGESV